MDYIKLPIGIAVAAVLAIAGVEGFSYVRGDTEPATAGAVHRNTEAIKGNAEMDQKEHREFYLAQASQAGQIEAINKTNTETNGRLKKIEEAQRDQALADAIRDTKVDAKLEAILGAIENGG